MRNLPTIITCGSIEVPIYDMMLENTLEEKL
jgi:hypothetical protein